MGLFTLRDLKSATPQTAGLFGWWDASDLSTITDAGSGHVSQWNDKSGLGRHLLQTVDAQRPITGTRTINSLNVLDFDGTDDTMTAAFTTIPQPLTIYVIAQNDNGADGTDQSLTDRYDAADDGGVLIHKVDGGSGNTWDIYAGGGGVLRISNGLANTAAHMFIGVFNSGSSSLTVDSITVTGSVFTNPLGNGITIGSARTALIPWNGRIGEAFGYNRVLTAYETSLNVDYARRKWGI